MHYLKFLTLFVFLLSACGPKIKNVKPEPYNISKIAILPTETDSELSTDDINTIDSIFKSKLQEKGFNILDQDIVMLSCEDKTCREGIKKISKEYAPDAFVKLKLGTTVNSNFVIGYYNHLSGEMHFLDQDISDIFYVESTESERGGVLFNSGQVLQGLKDTLDDWQSKPIIRMSEKFFDSLNKVIPSPTNSLGTASQNDDIEFWFENHNQGQTKACARSSKKGKATLLINQHVVHLRPLNLTVSKKDKFEYCTVIPFDKLKESANSLYAEVRLVSDFGDGINKDISESIK